MPELNLIKLKEKGKQELRDFLKNMKIGYKMKEISLKQKLKDKDNNLSYKKKSKKNLLQRGILNWRKNYNKL